MKLNHLGIAVRDINISATKYKENLGWEYRSEVFFDPIQNVNILFMGDENDILYELIEPVDENSPVSRLLNKRISLYHFCYEVDDIDSKIKELVNKKYVLISGPSKSVAFNGKRIAFLFNHDNLTIELVEK